MLGQPTTGHVSHTIIFTFTVSSLHHDPHTRHQILWPGRTLTLLLLLGALARPEEPGDEAAGK